jgi:microcin C transport system substrate-binding protein
MRLSRRAMIRGGLAATATPALDRLGLPIAAPAIAQTVPWRHGFSVFEEIKYPPGFKQFDYVNPNPLKGGIVRLPAYGTFDNFNLTVAGLKGNLARGAAVIYDTLLTESLDEVTTSYGLLAEALKYPPDYAWASFRLNPEARWHDGKPVTAEDVIFSFEIFKQQSPMYVFYYQHVVKAEKTGDREVTFTFDAPNNRELPGILGQLNVVPKHWWEGTNAEGKKRDITQTTLEMPLGCGAYRLKSFEVGRRTVYERVPDYWGRNLNVNVGSNNFDELRYEYFRDLTVALEGFKGDAFDFQTESSAQRWATAYDFPAVKDKRVLLEEFPHNNIGMMQGYVFNIRRDKFKDSRVRRAFNYAYDFEELNKQLSYNQYRRINSYFDGCELASSGLPSGLELEILETVRDKVPPQVFTTPYTNPVNGSPDAVRANLREAIRLFREAGYEVRNQRLTNVRTGAQFTCEFLLDDPAYERGLAFYKPSLDRLGINVIVRTVDDAQYQNRIRAWDYDIIIWQWRQSLSPGNEQRDFFGSAAADRAGSANYVGIKNPAVDALIERVIYAKSRAELVAACKAMDRVLLWNDYVVPQFNYGKDRTARWDRFGFRDPLPKYTSTGAFPTLWWWDDEKAAKAGARR